ncbi:hypothetical protein ACFIOY_37550 [Bradyrhizobium sp. TZ2]
MSWASGRPKTPLGYRNITGPDGKKIIAADPVLSPIVAWLFEWYARGDILLKEGTRGGSFFESPPVRHA